MQCLHWARGQKKTRVQGAQLVQEITLNVGWRFVYRIEEVEGRDARDYKATKETQQLSLGRSRLLSNMLSVYFETTRGTLRMSLDGLLDQNLEEVSGGSLGVIAVPEVNVAYAYRLLRRLGVSFHVVDRDGCFTERVLKAKTRGQAYEKMVFPAPATVRFRSASLRDRKGGL